MDGQLFYVSSFSASETPGLHVLEEFRADDKRMFTSGKPTNVQAPMGVHLVVDKQAGNVTVRPEVRSGVDATEVPLYVNASLLEDHNVTRPTAYDASGVRLPMSANRSGISFRANASSGDSAVHILNDTASTVEAASASCRDDMALLTGWGHDRDEGNTSARLYTRNETFCWEWVVGLGDNISSANLSHYQIHGRVTNQTSGERVCQIGFPVGDAEDNTSVGAHACRGDAPRPAHVNATFQVHAVSEPSPANAWVGAASVGDERTSCGAGGAAVHLRTWDPYVGVADPVEDLCDVAWAGNGSVAALAPGDPAFEEDQEAIVTNVTHPVNVSVMERALVNLSDSRYLIADEVVAMFNGSIPGNISEIVAPYGEVKLTNETLDMVVVSADSEYVVDEAVADLDSREDTKSAHQARYFELLAHPNDGYYANGSQWGIDAINATGAWHELDNTTYGSHEADIAMLDGGIDREHDDLDGNLICASDRHIDIVPRIYPSKVTENGGHGTWDAGIAGAETNNSEGIAGTSGACLTDVKVCTGFQLGIDDDGRQTGDESGEDDAISLSPNACPAASTAVGILNASSYEDIEILSLSLGCNDTAACRVTDSPAQLAGEIAYEDRGKLLIASAGNFGPANDTECENRNPGWPAQHDAFMAVAALSPPGDSRWAGESGQQGSNCGPQTSLSAPGDEITTTAPGGYSEGGSGTSLAAPFVSGVAALLYDEYNLNNTNLRCTLLDTADHLWEGDNETHPVYGDGRLNATAAVKNPAGHPAGGNYTCDPDRFN